MSFIVQEGLLTEARWIYSGARRLWDSRQSCCKLSSAKASSATRIFLDEASIKCALLLNSDDKAWSVQSQDQFTELRQLRTKLHDASTFMLCRTSGHFARHRSSQPYTVFNLVTYDRFRETGKGVAAAIIFNEITQNVLQKGAAGCLKRAVVEDARRQCGDGGKITKAFGDILALFKADSNSLTVLGDSTLNKAARFIEQSFAS